MVVSLRIVTYADEDMYFPYIGDNPQIIQKWWRTGINAGEHSDLYSRLAVLLKRYLPENERTRQPSLVRLPFFVDFYLPYAITIFLSVKTYKVGEQMDL